MAATGSTSRPPPPTAPTRSGSAPTSAAWRCATAGTCSRRPACRPTARRSARCGRPGTTSSPPASSSRRASATTRSTSSTRPPTPTTRSSCSAATTPTSTHDDNLVIETQPGRQGGLGPVGRHGRRRASPRKLKSFSNEWNAGFKNGTLRHRGLPGLDDRLHRGAGRRRTTPASGTSPPCPAAAATGAARSSPSRPTSENQDLAIELAQFLTSADGQLAAFEAVGNLPSNPTLYEDPARQGQDERVLQRRAGRADLRRRCQQPRAGLPRREEPAGA